LELRESPYITVLSKKAYSDKIPYTHYSGQDIPTVLNMKTLQAKKYIGDADFSRLLESAAPEVTIDRVKACILGVQSSLNNSGLSAVRDCIGAVKDEESRPSILSAVEGLWYHLYAVSDFVESEHVRFTGNPSDRNDCIDFVQRQIEAGDEFLKRLHLGGYRHGTRTDATDRLYTIFSANMELLRALKTSMWEKWTDDDYANMEGFIRKLERFTLVMWKTMLSIKNAMKKEKLQHMKNRAIIGKIEEQVGQPVRRNDLCPCGSGKKFKSCCGS